MTANDIINLAKNGELKTIAIKDDIDAVIGFINLGLIELYKRFPISQKEYIIEIMYHTTYYEMPSDYMWLIEAYQYIKPKQTIERQIDNVGTNVPVELERLAINDSDDVRTVNTVGHNQVQISNRNIGDVISLIYVASPKLVTRDSLNDELPIPAQMIEALLNYIGYRGHGSIDGKINAESNTHYQRFELSVKKIEFDGMINTEGVGMQKRIIEKGFL